MIKKNNARARTYNDWVELGWIGLDWIGFRLRGNLEGVGGQTYIYLYVSFCSFFATFFCLSFFCLSLSFFFATFPSFFPFSPQRFVVGVEVT